MTIKLNGLLGTFRIAESRFKINYVSTSANPARDDGHAALVKELKPMRDRLDASQLKDLGSLLQRDLNDFRVAQDLVPYLKGQVNNSIGFFPAILAVLVPKGYLADGATDYPTPAIDPDDPDKCSFGECWTVKQYRGENKTLLPLGMLELAPSHAEIIVLDGQHRASAFRYVAGDFDPGKDIHQMFYTEVTPLPRLDMDLPVTLIWFESDDGKSIDPKLISRRLFVDVNNNAKRVSASRTILLDDRAATCIATRAFYDQSARNGFAPDKFSLLHGAFDWDSDLTDGQMHKFALTTPELINNSLYWAFFGSTGFDQLSVTRVGREHVQNTRDKFIRIFPNFNDLRVSDDDLVDSHRRLFFDPPERAEAFRSAFADNYLRILSMFFDQFVLLRPHYQACASVAQWVMSEGGNTTQREVWNKVFCGGEGLYWSMKYAQNNLASVYQTAISEIEQKFSDERAHCFGQEREKVETVYGSFVTKAFQAGYVTAVEYLVRKGAEVDYSTAADHLVNRLSEYELSAWAAIFTSLRKYIMGSGVDPKAWPTYRNLIIRLYDGERGQFFSADNLRESPDWIAYSFLLDRAVVAYSQTVEQVPEDSELRRQAITLFEEVQNVLFTCDLSGTQWFERDTVLK